MVARLSRQRQAMNTPVLTIEELHNIETGAWFSKLSQTLRSAILSRALVRRINDGDPLASRGTPAEEWRLRVDLAAAYRLVAMFHWDDLVFTHISARVPGDEHHFLINPYGFMF